MHCLVSFNDHLPMSIACYSKEANSFTFPTATMSMLLFILCTIKHTSSAVTTQLEHTLRQWESFTKDIYNTTHKFKKIRDTKTMSCLKLPLMPTVLDMLLTARNTGFNWVARTELAKASLLIFTLITPVQHEALLMGMTMPTLTFLRFR